MLAKITTFFFVLCFVFLATPSIVSAQSGTATGTFKFIMEDDLLKGFEFDARSTERGGATGFMHFTDEAKLEFQDVDGTGDVPREEPVPFFMKADFETMTIEKNRAVINGTVRDSSYRSYIGKFVQLVVEDNGVEAPDKFVWSFCTPEPGGWIPEDAEVPGDRGAFLSWWATDAERKDDVGIPSLNLIPGNLKSCKVPPLRAFEFATFLKGEGSISIKQ